MSLTIDGFQCPTVEQDAEQNAPQSHPVYSLAMHESDHVRECHHVQAPSVQLQLPRKRRYSARPPAIRKTNAPPPAGAYTFQRAWKLRSNEILMLAERAQCRYMAARKTFVFADTTLFADMKEPKSKIEESEKVRNDLATLYLRRFRKSPPGHGITLILAFVGLPCK